MSVENGCVSVEFHFVEDTLGVRHVRSGESLDLVVLEGAILVPEALGASACGSCQVSVGLELPVGPTDEVLISNIANLVNFLAARALSEASTEFSDHKGDLEAFGILNSSANSLLVPLSALGSVGNLRLTSETFVGAELAAVGMVIEDVLIRADLTTRGDIETNIEDHARKNTNLIWERNWLEPHLLFAVVRLILLIKFLIHGGEVSLVHVAWDEKMRVPGGVRREWLIKRIVTNDVGVVSEASRGVVPVVDKGILESIVVVEKMTEESDRLLGQIVGVEVTRLAVSDQEIFVLILSETESLHISADTELVIDRFEKTIQGPAHAVTILLQGLLGVEVWHTLTANAASKHILMGIDEGVDTVLTKLVDHSLNLVEIVVIVDTFLSLDSFPHDTETDEVLTPLLEKGDILVIK